MMRLTFLLALSALGIVAVTSVMAGKTGLPGKPPTFAFKDKLDGKSIEKRVVAWRKQGVAVRPGVGGGGAAYRKQVVVGGRSVDNGEDFKRAAAYKKTSAGVVKTPGGEVRGGASVKKGVVVGGKREAIENNVSKRVAAWRKQGVAVRPGVGRGGAAYRKQVVVGGRAVENDEVSKRAAVAWHRTTGIVRRPSLMPMPMPIGGGCISHSHTVGVARRPSIMPYGGLRAGYMEGGHAMVAGKRDVDVNKNFKRAAAYKKTSAGVVKTPGGVVRGGASVKKGMVVGGKREAIENDVEKRVVAWRKQGVVMRPGVGRGGAAYRKQVVVHGRDVENEEVSKRAAVAWHRTTGIVRRPSLMPMPMPIGGGYISHSHTVGVARRPSIMPYGGLRAGYMEGGHAMVAGKRDVDVNKDDKKRYAFGHVSGHIAVHGHVGAEHAVEPY